MIERWKAALRKTSGYWKMAFEVFLIAMFIFYGIRHWGEVCLVMRRVSSVTLGICIATYTLSLFIAAATTKTLFAKCGHPIPYKAFLYIHLRRLPAKYVPGGIWQTVSRGADLVQLGVPTRSVLKILSLEQLLAIWWAGFIGFLLVAATFNNEPARAAAFIIAITLLIGAGLSIFFIVRFKPNAIDLVQAALAPKACLGYLGGWCCLATAFTAYLWVAGLSEVSPLRIAGSYLVSWMLGAIALFAPQGIGVFELSMQRAIFQSQDKAAALWLIGSYRLVVLGADLVAWLGAVLWHRATSFTNNKI